MSYFVCTSVTNSSNIPGEREMGRGPTAAVLDEVADWSVLATEDKSWLVGFGCTATRLAFSRGGSPQQLSQLPGQKDCEYDLRASGA